jgi:hypothetical protein
VHQIQRVGDQLPGRERGDPEPTTQLRRRELRHVRGAVAAEPPGPLPAVQLRDARVEGVGVVDDRVLDRGVEDLGLAPALRGGQQVDVVEELAPRHLLQRLDRHEPSQTATTDSPAAQNPISTTDSDIVTRS